MGDPYILDYLLNTVYNMASRRESRLCSPTSCNSLSYLLGWCCCGSSQTGDMLCWPTGRSQVKAPEAKGL
jgi:hypothetical protein